MLNELAGIQSDGPGYSKIIIYPHPPTPGSKREHEPIRWVKAHYDSIHGRVGSEWRRIGNKFELNVEVPANTTATIHVPALSAEAIEESGRPLSRVEGVKFLREENGCFVMSVQSGKYRFRTAIAATK